MLFQQKNKKAFKVVWVTLCVLIIVSMVIMYIPGVLV